MVNKIKLFDSDSFIKCAKVVIKYDFTNNNKLLMITCYHHFQKSRYKKHGTKNF